MYPLNKVESQLKLLRICDLHLKSSGEILPSGVQLIAEHLNREFLHDCSSIVLKLNRSQLLDCSAVQCLQCPPCAASRPLPPSDPPAPASAFCSSVCSSPPPAAVKRYQPSLWGPSSYFNNFLLNLQLADILSIQNLDKSSKFFGYFCSAENIDQINILLNMLICWSAPTWWWRCRRGAESYERERPISILEKVVRWVTCVLSHLSTFILQSPPSSLERYLASM